MASTGKTTNYELSQFIGTDKPSWLGDYNGDMLKIDTALGSINATATTAQSGVASAQSAASAAQMTANAAQQTATTNAQDITELKGVLTNTVVTANNTENVSDGTSVFAYSDYVQVLKTNITINVTNYTDFNAERRIPVCSITGNIFKIGSSTLADGNSKIYAGPVTGRVTQDGQNVILVFSLIAYFDGANTVFYIPIPTANVSSYTLTAVWGTAVTLFAGKFVNIF